MTESENENDQMTMTTLTTFLASLLTLGIAHASMALGRLCSRRRGKSVFIVI